MIKDFIETESVINLPFFDTIKEIVICNICLGILVNPRECNSCQNSFCKNCLDEWMCFNDSCPYKCQKTSFKDSSRTLKNLLEKLNFICLFCQDSQNKYTYLNYINHIKKCENIKVNCPTCNSVVYKKKLNSNKIYEKMKDNNNKLSEENRSLKEENKQLREEIEKIKKSQNESSFKITSNNNMNNQISIANNTMSNLHTRVNRFNLNDNPISIMNNNMNDISEIGLIDKCEHFKGNYIPIFSCCEKSFPCYLCHDKVQDHEYKISSKVVCLICKNIYSGSKCNNCNTHQIYRRKE